MAAGHSISVEEHQAAILSSLEPLPARPLRLDAAAGRVLATDVTARVNIPSFDNSSMDGYAVRRADLLSATVDAPVELPVVADLAAGTGQNPSIQPGEAARIMTGAPIPDGADAVVPIEDTDLGTSRVAIHQTPAPAAFIRRIGGDTRTGDRVLAAGTRLAARHIAAAAASGCDILSVYPAPRVGIISTGSELVELGEPLERGQIHDSNSYLLAAAVAEAGGEPVRLGLVPDDEDQFRRILAEHAGEVDAFLLSGGVSVGAYDVTKAVLSGLGTVTFSSVRMQPGKPQAFGRWTDGTPIFALPGNPVSAFVSFQVFVRPALRKLQGLTELQRPTTVASVARGWSSPAARRQYMPVTIQRSGPDGRTLSIQPATAGGSGSHLVGSLAAADALAIVDESVQEVRVGDNLTVMLVE